MPLRLQALSCCNCRFVLKSCHAEMTHEIIGTKTRGWFSVNHRGRLNVGFVFTSYLTKEIECWPTSVIDLL